MRLSLIPLLRVGVVLPVMGIAACTPLGVAATAVATVGSAAAEERGVDGAANDVAISSGILRRFLERDHRLLADVDVTVYERRALLMGIVTDPALKTLAVELTATDRDIIELNDHIEVRADGSVDLARDVAIASEIRSALVLDSRVAAVNYTVDVVDRVVYVMGLAQDAEERSRVIDWCRGTEYVRRVVDLVWLKNDPRRRSPSAGRAS